MKQTSTFLTLLCMLTVLHVSAQKDVNVVTPHRNGVSYIDPAPTGFEPVRIDSEEAISEAQSNTKLAGFSEAYFSGIVLSEILRDPKAVGIRFYNAYEPNIKAFTVVAVAIREDGSELSSGSSRKYLISTPNNKTELHWKGYARTCVELCRDVKNIVTIQSKFIV